MVGGGAERASSTPRSPVGSSVPRVGAEAAAPAAVLDASLAELEGVQRAGRTPVRLTVQRLLSLQALAPVHTSALRASRPRVGLLSVLVVAAASTAPRASPSRASGWLVVGVGSPRPPRRRKCGRARSASPTEVVCSSNALRSFRPAPLGASRLASSGWLVVGVGSRSRLYSTSGFALACLGLACRRCW